MAETTKRLFLLDGMALVYRAHFALIRSPIINSKRQNVSAIFGFTNTLLDILENHQPTHIGVAFDTKEPTPRHKLFPAYKAQRDAMPEDLAAALPEIKRVIKAFNIPVIEQPGFEADDIIGTLTKLADEQGDYHTFMVTPDKDFAQLVSPTTSMWKPGRKGSDVELMGVPEILSKWEIEHTEQVIDILGLWGDASDNIPGVPGIGEKTAKKLIAAYGSVEGLLANTHKLKGKQKENVINNREQALLSKELVKIILDVPTDVSFEELEINSRDDQSIKSLFTEFEFNSLGKRLYGAEFSSGRGHTTSSSNGADETIVEADLKTFSDFKKSYTLVNSEDALDKLVKQLEKQDMFCFDLETTSLNPRVAKLLGVALSWKADEAYFVSASGTLTDAQIYEKLAPIFSSKKTKIGHNLKYDLSVLFSASVKVEAPFFDTMLAHAMTHPEQRHSMDFVAESLLGYTPIKLADISTPAGGDDLFSHAAKKKDKKLVDMTAIPVEKLCTYACEDADITFQLAEILAEKLESENLQDVFYDIESPLLPVLTHMENEGIKIDVPSLSAISKTLESKITALHADITEQAGKEFNLNSPKQLGTLLFDDLKLVEKPKTTKTGQYKTDEPTLAALAPKHKIVSDILEYRECTKLKSTYVDALPSHQCPSDGRIHSSFHQLITSTGRLASSDPNIQNIPVRTDAGKEIRKAFIPTEGFTLFAADYSQVELRVMAGIANDQNMIEAFQQGHDIHTATAARVYGVGLGEVVDTMRRTAKMVNFGIIYGISAFGLSQRLGIPRGEASSIIDTYFTEYPAIKTFMDKTIEEAHENGYVSTLTGRKRFLRDINSRNANIRNAAERAAINTPIQGTAADMIKLAMVHVDTLLTQEQAQTKMLLQVHDELIFDLHPDEQETLTPKIIEAMQNALPLPHGVPVKVDSDSGQNWLEAH